MDWDVAVAAPAEAPDAVQVREVAEGRAARASEGVENACVQIAATLLPISWGLPAMILNAPDAEPK